MINFFRRLTFFSLLSLFILACATFDFATGRLSVPSPTLSSALANRTATIRPTFTSVPTMTLTKVPLPVVRTATPSSTRTPTPKRISTLPPTVSTKPQSTVTPPAAPWLTPSLFAAMHTDPYVALISDMHLFTSVCYGKDANPLQEEDHINGGDWTTSRRDDCVFGYAVNPASRLPTKSYRVMGERDQQRRFYLIPPEAFAEDQQSIKELAQIQLILAPDQGCPALGSLGVTADGLTYQCDACSFLTSGGVCPATNGSKALVLPANNNLVFDSDHNGGAYGFQGFPAVLFKKDFSLYFTGKDGYAPPSLYFENIVDFLLPEVNPKTTAEMTALEIRDLTSRFETRYSNVDPKNSLASIGIDAFPLFSPQLTLKAKQEIVFSFSAKPGAILSNVSLKFIPVDNVHTRQFLETNPCLLMNAKEYCFTGVEDFAHCAFFAACTTGFSSLKTVGGIVADGYIATRYFPAGAAPVLKDGRLSIRLVGPDIGSFLQVEAAVQIRNPSLR